MVLVPGDVKSANTSNVNTNKPAALLRKTAKTPDRRLRDRLEGDAPRDKRYGDTFPVYADWTGNPPLQNGGFFVPEIRSKKGVKKLKSKFEIRVEKGSFRHEKGGV